MIFKRLSAFWLALLTFALWLCLPANAQTVGSAIPGALGFQYFDNSGVPLVNGKVCTYQAGTTTPLATYTDATLGTANTNPVLLTSGGVPTGSVGIFIGQTQKYKFVFLQGGDSTCLTGAVIRTWDNISNSGQIGVINGTSNQVTVITTGITATVSLPTQVITTEFTATAAGTGIAFSGPNTAINGDGLISTGSTVIALGGFVSQANSWNGYNTNTDGGLFRGVTIAPNVAGTKGGFIDMAPILYAPNGNSSTCFDEWGNPATQPMPLPGETGLGTNNDLLIWVSTSGPIPASCGPSVPTNLIYGLQTNGYMYPFGGFATPQAAYNAINAITVIPNTPAGGVVANTLIAGTLYPAGTVTTTGTLGTPKYLGGHVIPGASCGVPAAGTISTTTNPLSQGEGLFPGEFYFDTCLGYWNGYTGTVWQNIGGSGGGGGGGSPVGGASAIQTYATASTFYGDSNFTYVPGTGVALGGSAASFFTTGTSGGFDAALCTAANCLQAPLGGSLVVLSTLIERSAPAVSNTGQATFYADSASHFVGLSQNASAYNWLAMMGSTLPTNGHCASWTVVSGLPTLVDAGGACTTGGGGGTVASSTINNVAFYTGATTVGGSTAFTFNPGTNVLVANGGMATVGAFTATGSSGAGFNVTSDTAYNSFQSVGGAAFCTAGGCSGGPALSVGSGAPFQVALTGATTALSMKLTALTGFTQCLQVNTVGQVSGTGLACGGGGGGAVTGIIGTAAQVLANGTSGSTQTGNVILTLPQNIATSSGPTFASVTANGVFQSTVTGTSIAFQSNGGTAQVNGYGDGSFGGTVNAVGRVTCPGGSGAAVYQINGTCILDSSFNLQNINAITAALIVSAGGGVFGTIVSAAGGFEVGGSHVGVSCSSINASTFVSWLGIVTHC
jgi:hypothetical protein